MNLLEWIRIVLIGIIEGITEWLPIKMCIRDRQQRAGDKTCPQTGKPGSGAGFSGI